MRKKLNTRCFLDIKVGDAEPERIVLELFDEKCPKACDNFKKLCQGLCGIGIKTGKPLHYQGSCFHRIIKGFIIQGGDFSNGDGTGGESIYGGTFADEDMSSLHDRPFLLSMANRGPNTNGSQFFITTAPAPHLNGKHMVFGHVISGQGVVAKIEAVPVSDTRVYKPIKPVAIFNCGELVPVKKKKSENSKKIKKKKKKSAKKKYRKLRSSPSDSDSIKIRPEEIPDVPMNKFLYRSCPVDTKNTYVTNQHYSSKSRSGRTVKGRGHVRYRSPDPRTGGRDRGITPEHWHQAATRPQRKPQDEFSQTKRPQKRQQFSAEEKPLRDERTRSPLDTERPSIKYATSYAYVMNEQSPNNPKNANAKSPVDTHDKKRDRIRDKRRRQTTGSGSDEPLSRQAGNLSPDVPQTVNSSSDLRDLRHGFHRRRTPSPPKPPPPQSSPSKFQDRSRPDRGVKTANESRRSSFSEHSPSPSAHWVKTHASKRKLSRSPSPPQLSSLHRSRKRSSENETRQESPSMSRRPIPKKRATSRNRLENVERRKPSSPKAQTRADFHGSLRDPPAHLVNKWEERRKQVLRKRDSLLKVSRRRDVSPGSPSASSSKSSPSHLHPATPTRHSSSSPSLSPTQIKSSSNAAPDQIDMPSIHDIALPTETKPPPSATPPPARSSPEVVSRWNQSPSTTTIESRKEEVEVENDDVGHTSSPQAAGPWTTSRWQTDDGSGNNITSSKSNMPTRSSPVKLALVGNSEVAPVMLTSVEMDVSDTESEPKKVEAPIKNFKNGHETSIPDVAVEDKLAAPSVNLQGSKSPKPKSPSVSSSTSSTSSTSSESSSSDASSSSHSRNISESSRRKKPAPRRGRSRSSSRSRFRRRSNLSHRSNSGRRRRSHASRGRKRNWSRRSRSFSSRSRRRRRSSPYSPRRRCSYSSYSDSTRSSYSSAS